MIKKETIQKLFFCIVSFILFGGDVIRISAGQDNVITINKEIFNEQKKVDEELKPLVEHIYNLILDNHSQDEIIKIINENPKKTYDIQKLIKNIYELLNQQKSRDTIINIVVEINNKKSKDSLYKFLLPVCAILSGLIGIYCLLGFPFLREFIFGKVSSSEIENINDRKNLDDSDNNQLDSQLRNYIINKFFDAYIAGLVKEQLKVAKNRGLLKEEGLIISKWRGNKYFRMTLKEQINYARKIGLIEK